MESFSDQITRVGFSLLFQAVIRPDSKYLQEDEDGEDGEAMEEESLEAGDEEDEEPMLEGLAAHGDHAEESGATLEETEVLGKRKVNGKAQPAKQDQGKSNGQTQAPKPQVKPGEQPAKQKKTS